MGRMQKAKMNKQEYQEYINRADAKTLEIVFAILSANHENQKKIAKAIKGKPINESEQIIKSILNNGSNL